MVRSFVIAAMALIFTLTGYAGSRHAAAAGGSGLAVQGGRLVMPDQAKVTKDSDKRKVRFSYDDEDRITGITGPSERKTMLGYDRRGRLESIDNGELVTYKYDRMGRVTTFKDTTGSTTMDYDYHGRIRSMNYPETGKVSYEYFEQGEIKFVGWKEHYLKYERNLLGNIISMQTPTGIFKITYDYNKRIMQRQYPSGAVSQFIYDRSGRAVLISHLSPDRYLILEFKYSYSKAGLLEQTTERGRGRVLKIDYSYDRHGQLIRATYSDGRVYLYTYDLFGNLTESSGPTGKYSATYDDYDQIKIINGKAVGHDPAGNVTGIGESSYEYDGDNALLSDGIKTYRYNGVGMRVEVFSDKGKARFLHLIDGLPYVLAETGTEKIGYIWADGQILGQIGKERGVVFYLEDHLGSVRAAMDKAGNIIGTAEYSPFGVPIRRINGLRFGYAGEEQDENGRVYLRARYYEPETARFISKDPILPQLMDEKQQNRYQYAANSPLSFVDRDGRQAESADSKYSDWHKINEYLGNIEASTTPFERWLKFGSFPGKEMDIWPGQFTDREVNEIEVPILGKIDMNWRVLFRVQSPWLGVVQVGTIIAPVYNVFEYLGFYESDLSGALYALVNASPGAHIFFPDLVKSLRNKSTWQTIDQRNKNFMANYKGLFLGIGEAMGHDMIGLLEKIDRRRKNKFNDDTGNVAENFHGGPRGPGGSASGGGGPSFTRYSGSSFMGSSVPLRRQPNVGGVYLDKAAEVIGDLSRLDGVVFDPKSNRILLIGDKSGTGVAMPPMRLDNLATAYRAVFGDHSAEPGVTIDPDPKDPYAELMNVIFFGGVGDTHFGRQLFEADRIMKSLSLGKDNITGEKVGVSVKGYYNSLDLGFSNLGGNYNEKLWSRFWLVPEQVIVRVSDDRRSLTFPDTRIRVKTETMRWEGEKLVPAKGQVDEKAEYFANHFTRFYDDYAKEYPVFAELKTLANMVGFMKWIKEGGTLVDLGWLKDYEKYLETPKTTPSLTVEDNRYVGDNFTKKISIFGGTDLTVKNLYVKDDGVSREYGRKALSTVADTSGVAVGEFKDNDKKIKKVVALPTSQMRAPGSKMIMEQELDLVTRYYNSFHNGAGPFGYSWVMDLPVLRITRPEADKTNTVSAGYQRVEVKSFHLSRPFGLLDITFKDYKIDQESGRIVFLPERRGEVKGLYPSSIGSEYSVEYTSGKVEVFDAGGRLLRAEFPPAAKLLYSYDDSGRLLSIEEVRATEKVAEIRLFYDGKGRVASAKSPGGTVRYSYDLKGNLAKVVRENQTVEYSYEDRHLVTEIRVNGKKVATIKYDDYGRAVMQTGPNGESLVLDIITSGGETIVSSGTDMARLVIKYDAGGRLLEEKTPGGELMRNTYSEYGSLKSTEYIDEFGDTSKAEYSPDNRYVKYTNPEGFVRAFLYDDFGRLKQVQDGKNALISKKYGQTGRGWLETTESSEQTVQVLYNKEKKPVEEIITARSGRGGQVIISSDYNSAGVLKRRTTQGIFNRSRVYKDGLLIKEVSGKEDTVTYVYDEQERPLLVSSDDQGVRFSYDQAGLLDEVNFNRAEFSERLSFKDGLLTQRTNTDGLSDTFQYDEHAMLRGVERGSRETWSIERGNNKTTYIRNNVVQMEFVFDSKGMLTEALY